jgi:hypothetical protein
MCFSENKIKLADVKIFSLLVDETTMIKVHTQGDDYLGVTYDTFKNKQL